VARGDPEDASTQITAALVPAARAGHYRVTVLTGPDTGRAFEIDGGQPLRVLMGTGPACTFQLTDRQVSRRHAAFEAGAASLRCTDLGSTNGIFVNGLRVFDACLRGGETLQLGETTARVDLVRGDVVIPLSEEFRFGRLIGSSPAMRRLYPLLEKLATADVPLIIEGETGTGKELLAESLHEQGARASKPFVVFDCTAVSPTLVESALFGHEKGAFTGAAAARRGVFEQADGGTLLIDEIGDLDLALQAKLLRAIQRSEVQRVGGEKWLRVDVRVIAATRRDLDAEVQARRFRDDLFFRLNVARVELPPLRARAGDVGMLARHFWNELGRDGEPLPSDFLPRMESYLWPGNVRELYNLVSRARALGDLASDEALVRSPRPASSDLVQGILDKDLPFIRAKEELVGEFERRYVRRALERFGGNVSKAAAASGIARRYFYDLKNRAGD
jgi:transcriptional regulator with GAF, ATPase, and Fis domain